MSYPVHNLDTKNIKDPYFPIYLLLSQVKSIQSPAEVCALLDIFSGVYNYVSLTMNPLYHCLICLSVKLVLSIRTLSSSSESLADLLPMVTDVLSWQPLQNDGLR